MEENSYQRSDFEVEDDDDEIVVETAPIWRFGGAQAAHGDEDEEGGGEGGGEAEGEDEAMDEEKQKAMDRERKKAEVRRRLEDLNRMKKAKKGFLTPDRKKKLRKLLMEKAAEDLKRQQMERELERQRILQERTIQLPDIDSISDKSRLEEIAKEFQECYAALEADRYDLDFKVRHKEFEINELSIQVNDLRGKFVKPTLKKVAKFDAKFDKMKQTQAAKVDFRESLQKVEVNKFAIDETKLDKKAEVEWAKK